MNWNIEFYRDQRARSEVKEFLVSLSKKERAKIGVWIDLLEEYGIDLTEPYVKHLADKIWELKAKEIRILYFLHQQTFVLLHAFKKKTQKTPKDEILTAIKKMKDYLERRK